MKETRTLNDYLKLEYDMHVRKKDGFFIVGIPELGIMKKGEKFEAAFAEMNRAKDELIKTYFDNGYTSWIPEPASGRGSLLPSGHELQRFE